MKTISWPGGMAALRQYCAGSMVRFCVVGCGAGTVAALVGRTVTVDASSGTVYGGELPTSVVDESEDDDLRRLTEWAEAHAPVTVSATGGPDPVFDADALVGEQLPPIPAGTKTVRGAVFCAPDGVRAAVDAGVEVIVAAHRLPVLLAAVAHVRTTS